MREIDTPVAADQYEGATSISRMHAAIRCEGGV